MSESAARSNPIPEDQDVPSGAPVDANPGGAPGATEPAAASPVATPGASAPAPGAIAEAPATAAAPPQVQRVIDRHWNTLGIPPTDNLDALDAAYCVVLSNLPRHPTEEDEAKAEEIKAAYSMLRRYVESRGPAPVSRALSPGMTSGQRLAAGAAVVLGLLVLAYLNWGTLKLEWVEFPPGTVLKLGRASEPYATVIRFDPSHRFAVGPPTRAYQLKLARGEQTIWLSERVVEKGMTPTK